MKTIENIFVTRQANLSHFEAAQDEELRVEIERLDAAKGAAQTKCRTEKEAARKATTEHHDKLDAALAADVRKALPPLIRRLATEHPRAVAADFMATFRELDARCQSQLGQDIDPRLVIWCFASALECTDKIGGQDWIRFNVASGAPTKVAELMQKTRAGLPALVVANALMVAEEAMAIDTRATAHADAERAEQIAQRATSQGGAAFLDAFDRQREAAREAARVAANTAALGKKQLADAARKKGAGFGQAIYGGEIVEGPAAPVRRQGI